MTTMTYASPEGKTLTLGEGRLKILGTQGLEAPPMSLIVAKGPTLDGAILVNGQIEPRQISIDALLDLRDLGAEETLRTRASIAEALLPAEGCGTLTVTRAGRTRCIEATPKIAPIFSPPRWNEHWQKLKIEFVCGQVAFQDTAEETYDLLFYTTRTEFPEYGIEFPDGGIEFSRTEATRERSTMIVNRGNYPAPVRIRFTGPFVNPFLRNMTTGETIRIAQRLYEDEYLEIDTTPGKRSIRITQHDMQANGMHYLDLSSSFWMLAPGQNLIEIGDESPSEGSEAFFAYASRYLEA